MAKRRGSYARRNTELKRDELREREQHERWTARIITNACNDYWKRHGCPEPSNRWRIESDSAEA